MAALLTLRCFDAPFFWMAVTRPVSVLGRSSQCDLVVDDASISRHHAEIRLGDGHLRVTDLQSHNGTFVDGQPIRDAEVSPGQRIRFGKITFVVVDPGAVQFHSDDETDDASKQSSGNGNGKPLQPADEELSEAQQRVFDLLLTGHPEKAIAKRLKLSQHTIHNHVRAILKIYGVHSRLELLAGFFHRNGGA